MFNYLIIIRAIILHSFEKFWDPCQFWHNPKFSIISIQPQTSNPSRVIHVILLDFIKAFNMIDHINLLRFDFLFSVLINNGETLKQLKLISSVE